MRGRLAVAARPRAARVAELAQVGQPGGLLVGEQADGTVRKA
jgi:hypothetical protein